MSTKRLTRRTEVNGYRDGNAQDFLDTVIAILGLRNKLYEEARDLKQGDYDSIEFEYHRRLEEMIEELHSWNITQIGDLYWTSGGRIVLDKGYGEYFNNSDKKLFSLEELTRGMDAEKFIKKLQESKKGRRMKYSD